MMLQPIPYLSFDGTCAEAMRFYERALGGRLELLLRGADLPMAAQIPPEHAQRIVHARLVLPGGAELYAGDCPPHMKYSGIHGVGLTLNYATVAEATATFATLAAEGRITMPLSPMFWADVSGMLTDRFGTPWVINGPLRAMNPK